MGTFPNSFDKFFKLIQHTKYWVRTYKDEQDCPQRYCSGIGDIRQVYKYNSSKKTMGVYPYNESTQR